MKPLEIFVKPTITYSKSAFPVKAGSLKPILNNHSACIYAPNLGPEIALHLRGSDDKQFLGNALASYSPDCLHCISSIWSAFEKAAEKIGDATGEFQATILGGVKGNKMNPLAQDSENFFYEILEGCYKKGYNYTAIGLKSPEASLDTAYITPQGVYLQNNDFKEFFKEKKLYEYTQEEVEQLLSGVYNYMEVGEKHSILAGDRLALIRKN